MSWPLKIAATSALLCLLFLAAVDSTAQMWSVPTNISNTSGASYVPAIAIDPSGNIHVVWSDNIFDKDSLMSEILYSFWDGTRWSKPVNISNNSGTSGAPAIAVDTSGGVHVVWQDNTLDKVLRRSEILYSRWNGIRWSDPVNISNNPGNSAVPAIAVDTLGNVHVVWRDNIIDKNNDPLPKTQIFYSRWDGTSWSKPINVFNTSGDSDYPKIAMDKSGKIHLTWRDNSRTSPFYSQWDGTGWSKPISVTNTARGGGNASGIALDSLGNPHVVWDDSTPGNLDIFYSRWEGLNWSKPVNISNNDVTSFHPVIAIDNSGNIHVVWFDPSPGNPEILYSKCDSTGWSKPINISNTNGDSRYPAIAIDATGNVHVVWEDSALGNQEILYSRKLADVSSPGIKSLSEVEFIPPEIKTDTVSDNNNISKTAGMSGTPAVAIDPLGNPHAVWIDNTPGDYQIAYSFWNGTNWSSPVNISNTVGESSDPAIAIDASGVIHVIWQDNTTNFFRNTEILYSRGNGKTWTKPTNISNAPGVSSHPAIAIDNLGNIHVVWSDNTTNIFSEILYSQGNGRTWTKPTNISNTPGVSDWPAIAVDISRNIHVVWVDKTTGNPQIFYSRWNGTSWSNPINISNTDGISGRPAIAIDVSGNPRMVWSKNSEIFYSRWDGINWSNHTNISNNAGGSVSPKIAIDKLGNPHVVWSDSTLSPENVEIFYSGWDFTSWPVNISNKTGGSSNPSIAIDNSRNIHVVWEDSALGNSEIFYIRRAADVKTPSIPPGETSSLKESFLTSLLDPKKPKLNEAIKVQGQLILPGEKPEAIAKQPINLTYIPPKGDPIFQKVETDSSGIYKAELKLKDDASFIGIWKATAQWQGNDKYKPSQQTFEFEIEKGIAKIIWNASIPKSATIGEKIDLIGQISPMIKGANVRIQVINPNGVILKTEKIVTNEFGAFQIGTQFETSGIWKVVAIFDGNENYQVSQSEELSIIAKRGAKAIIVLGGENEFENPAWNTFGELANRVYKILKRRAYSDDDIYYLSPSLKQTEAIDKPTSESSLEFAITQWAAKQVNKHVPLLIYFLSHNLDDKFLLEKQGSREVILTPEKLSGWLDQLPEGTPVTLIIEACHSGAFVTKKINGKPVLSKPNRVIIATAKEDRQAYILPNGSSFTRLFFDKIWRNFNVRKAYEETVDLFKHLPQHRGQLPQIDANGDGIANDPIIDLPAVEGIYIPDNIEALPIVPEIVDISPHQQVKGERTAKIWTKVSGVDVTRVFGNVIPPNFNPDKRFKDWSDLAFDEIEFKKTPEGKFEGIYDKFIQSGKYSIVVYAENPDGDATPVETIVTILSPTLDVNSDGEVNIFDLVLIVNNIGQQVKETDVNSDGKVDTFDLVLVANHFGEKLKGASPSTMTQMDYSQYLPLLERAYQLLHASSNPSPEFEMARRLLERLISLATPVVKETKLLPNYPNPFNPETWIPYQLSESADVIIEVYDVTGRLVRTLSLGRQSPGLYINKDKATYWDGRNDAGERVASGVYYYRMQAGRFTAIRKMVIAK